MLRLKTGARRLASATVLAGVGVVLSGIPAYAPHVAQMQVTPSTAKPGEAVTVFGPRGYGATNPVQVRWDKVDGPVLGEFRTRETGFAMWGPETITIPADAKAGIHSLWVTQKLEPSETIQRGIPVQTVIQIADANGAVPVVGEPLTPQVESRPGDFVEKDSVSPATLLFVALGAGGVALFVAGTSAVTASRRRTGAVAEAAKAGVR
ncbi:MAG: hypothetical protein ACRD2W_08525 [Acidimicrobiales bacterium]